CNHPACTTTFQFDNFDTTSLDWMASVLGRVGVVQGNNQIYAIGGWSFARFTTPMLTQMWAGNRADFGQTELSFLTNGPTNGGGWEHKVNKNWSTTVEYRYTRVANTDVGVNSSMWNAKIECRSQSSPSDVDCCAGFG